MILRTLGEAAALLNSQTLVLADLHIGFESELAERGIRIPDQTPKILKRIVDLKEGSKAKKLVMLGDLKHSVPRMGMMSWFLVPRFMERIVKLFEEVALVPGNHDGDIEPLIPREVRVLPAHGTSIGDVWLTHGHAKLPEEAFKKKMILMGHLHPAVQLTDISGYAYTYRVWLRGRLKKEPKPEVIVFPAFNEYMGQLMLNRSGWTDVDRGPIFSEETMDIKRLDVETLDLIYLGKLEELMT
ncbi:MAG: metallophosphoesterase [Thermoproteota archaeon]